jgi:ABC-type amino acid transport substrate-binding protein
VSETLVEEINRSKSSKPARIVPVERIDQALSALSQERIDVMLADELQLRYLIASNQSPNIIPVLAIEGIRPELQGFALSPKLPADLVRRIDLAISELKRSGVVQELRREALAREQPERGEGDQN